MSLATYFILLVQIHIAELIESGHLPIVGVIMGTEKVRWSWEDIINKRHGFFLELEMTVARKEPIFMKVHIYTFSEKNCSF